MREYWNAFSQAKDIWQKTTSNESTKFFERFIANKQGLYAMYPATQLPEDYDFKDADWFNLALAEKDKLVVTPPRSSEYGRCDVITLAHTVLYGK